MIGTYEGHVDAKGRMFLLSSFRVKLGDAVMAFVGDLPCVKLYSTERLTNLRASGITIPNADTARECAFDAQGRIVIPIVSRDSAQLVDRVIAIGVGDHLEIWNLELFERNKTAVGHDPAKS